MLDRGRARDTGRTRTPLDRRKRWTTNRRSRPTTRGGRLVGVSLTVFLVVAAFLVVVLATTVARSVGGLHDAGRVAVPAVTTLATFAGSH